MILTFLGACFRQISSPEGCRCSSGLMHEIKKRFASLYSMNPLGKGCLSSFQCQSIVKKFLMDMVLLSVHLAIIVAVNISINKIPVLLLSIITEFCFLSSSFMLSVMPFTVIYTSQLNTAYFCYFLEILLILVPKIIIHFDVYSHDQVTILVVAISLIAHVLCAIILAAKTIRRIKNKILLKEVNQLLLINLKDEADNMSLSSYSSEDTKQHCLVAFKNTIKLIQLTISSKSQDDSDNENLEENNNNNDIEKNNQNNHNNNNQISSLIANGQIPLNPITLSEIVSSGLIPNSVKNDQNNEQNQQFHHKAQTPSKMGRSKGMKLKLEDEPTVRKNSKIQYESPSMIPILSTVNAPQSSNRINAVLSYSQNSNTLPNSQSCVLPKRSGFKDGNKRKKQQQPSKIGDMIQLGNDKIWAEIINSIEIKTTGLEEIELLSFDEAQQQVLVKIEGAILFYSVPDFKKKKSILLDDTSQYLFNARSPTCVQYHYNSTTNQYQFTPLDLSKEKITKNDMKYSSINMNHAEHKQTSSLLLLASFGSPEQNNNSNNSCNESQNNKNNNNFNIDSPNTNAEALKQLRVNHSQVLFIQDGPDLITVNMGSLAMETYENKLSFDEKQTLSITQLNNRQVAINSQTQLKTNILDIPTNICYKILNDLAMGSVLLPITNLQNQLILNSLNTQSSVVFDLLTKQSMVLSNCGTVSSAFFIHKNLYVIDSSSHQLKVYSLQNTPFNLLPPSDNGISCISAAFT